MYKFLIKSILAATSPSTVEPATDATSNEIDASSEIVLPDAITNNSTGTAANHDLTTVSNFIENIIDIAIQICLLAGIFMIIYASITYLTAYGDDSKAETGKKTLLAAVIGTIFVYLCQVFVGYFKNEFY